MMSIGTMLFNPFNGKPRRPEDIASDPSGILVWDGEEPLRAASRTGDTEWLREALEWYSTAIVLTQHPSSPGHCDDGRHARETLRRAGAR